MPWGVAAAAAGAVVSSALAPSPGGGDAAAAAGAADPFASQRPQYQQQLQQMMTGNFTPDDPSYQFRFQQGQDAVNAGMGSSGMLNSGNRALALQQYGQNEASTEYANQFSRLSQLAGANVGSPAAAGQIINGQNQQQQAGASAIGNAVGTAVKGWGSSGGFGSGSSGSSSGGESDLSGINYDEADF